ncbi:hypothetical protein R3P38DRAFT_3522753 [Favolaschia claudopus]|uniref:Uncharacterized protein n=1 Tax=Favolaschia claudopus TaxID=2862362 RepID=A0AAW0E6L2_9AGAR
MHQRQQNIYGEGAPQGDPFVNAGLQPPHAHRRRAREQPQYEPLGRGPPPTPSRPTRSVSVDSPGAAPSRLRSFADPTSLDSEATPTPNRIAYMPQHLAAVPHLQYGLVADQNTQLLLTLVNKMDALLAESHHTGSALQDITRRVTRLEEGMQGPQPVRRQVIVQSNDSEEWLHPSLRSTHGSDDSDSEFDADDSEASTGSVNAPEIEFHSGQEAFVIDEQALTKSEKTAARLHISDIFRQFVNVPVGKEWPPIDEVRVDRSTPPRTNFDVKHFHNSALFERIGLRAQQLMANKASWPGSLKRLKKVSDPFVWDLAFTTECAKGSFRSFKRDWRLQQNTAARGKDKEEKEKRDRRVQRRVVKSTQIAKVIDAVAVDKNDDYVQFLHTATHPEYLSDEVSGPDSDGDEGLEDWVYRLAKIANLPTDPASLKKTNILEVLVPDWRADEYGDFVHSLEQRYQRKGKGGNTKQYHRVNAGRASKRIPRYAPYNSGIKSDWLDEARGNNELALQVADWGKYEAPVGCEFESLDSA